MRQGVRLEPLLEAISKFLDSQHEMIERVRRDLVRGLKKPRKGRRGLTAQQVLRSLIVMRVKNWDYRELRERIADGYTLRQFTGFYCQPVPKHDAFNRGFNRLTPDTLKAVNDLVVQAAVGLGLEDGTKLRVDTTVVQTDIHHPTDNTLLWDVVRVVTRLVGRLAKALELRRIKGFRDRTRSARRRMYEIQRMTTRQRHEQQTGTYRELIGITEEVVERARSALRRTRKVRGKDLLSELAIEALRKDIEHYCGHRGAHLGPVPRSRHEALPRRRGRALRVVGCCGSPRQQPHEHCGVADQAIVSQTKSNLTTSYYCRRLAADQNRSRLSAAPATLRPKFVAK